MAKIKDKTRIVPSTGNVFSDLGLTNAEEKQTEVRLAVAINEIIEASNCLKRQLLGD